jgi:plasmid stability protein
MGSIAIRNLDEAVKRRLRVRAAEHGARWEAREILRQAVGVTALPIAAARRADGRPIAGADCQVAAIARAHKAAVATRNGRDFAGCGIEVVDPWDGHSGA